MLSARKAFATDETEHWRTSWMENVLRATQVTNAGNMDEMSPAAKEKAKREAQVGAVLFLARCCHAPFSFFFASRLV